MPAAHWLVGQGCRALIGSPFRAPATDMVFNHAQRRESQNGQCHQAALCKKKSLPPKGIPKKSNFLVARPQREGGDKNRTTKKRDLFLKLEKLF